MATSATLLQLVIHSKYGGHGWSDKWFLDYPDFASASLIASRIAIYRARALAPGGEVVWARMSFVDTPRNTVACLNAPIKPLAYTGEQATAIQDPYTALHFRYETADGQWANRLIRGIGDDVVANFELVPSITTNNTWRQYGPTDALPSFNDPGIPHSNMVLAYLEYARRNTVHAKLDVGPTVSYIITPWSKVIFRKVANRDTGRAFGMTRGRAPKRAAVVTPSP